MIFHNNDHDGFLQVQSVGLILTCNDLEVNGTGRAVLDIDEVNHRLYK